MVTLSHQHSYLYIVSNRITLNVKQLVLNVSMWFIAHFLFFSFKVDYLALKIKVFTRLNDLSYYVAKQFFLFFSVHYLLAIYLLKLFFIFSAHYLLAIYLLIFSQSPVKRKYTVAFFFFLKGNFGIKN